ncbi:insulin-like 3 [Sorex araneus]|uniref:insulin-like 3 n=1 Tax=Sorex araneus TaxID=42254 RepID=UPI002433D9A3|nr:insulin-like 3 [Sorex araneus]
MAPRALPWALTLLGAALALGPAPGPEAPERLCGHRLVRALVRACGGPRWSPEEARSAAGGDRELLQWLEQRHLQDLVADGDMVLPRSRRSRAADPNPAQHCCLHGCARRSLLALCPR